MAAYVISEISEVLDGALMQEYRSLAQAAIEQYGGKNSNLCKTLDKAHADRCLHGSNLARDVKAVGHRTMANTMPSGWFRTTRRYKRNAGKRPKAQVK